MHANNEVGTAQSWLDDRRIVELRDAFWEALQAQFGDRVTLNGHPDESLPNTLNVSFREMSSQEILARMPNVAASTGSACHAGVSSISPVLEAMGVGRELGLGAIRFSLGRDATRREIDAVVGMLARIGQTPHAASRQ